MRILSAITQTILVAEDDELIAQLVSLNVERAGYRAVWSKNGVEALKRIAECSPALLLLDLGLPMVDGFAVLADIRRRRAQGQLIGPRFPIIVMTARHSADDVMRAISLGACDYLAKPFRIPDLLSRISEQLDGPTQSEARMI